MESVIEEAEARRKQAPPGARSGYGMGGDPRDFPYLQSLIQAGEEADFDPPFAQALERYREDAGPDNPTGAPKEFWSSTCRFRGVLYEAGRTLGPAAAVYLDRIPDPDLRLLAGIELAAALAGLPELRGPESRAPQTRTL